MNGAAIATRTLPRMAIPSAIPLDGLLFTSAQGPGPGADADFPKRKLLGSARSHRSNTFLAERSPNLGSSSFCIPYLPPMVQS